MRVPWVVAPCVESNINCSIYARFEHSEQAYLLLTFFIFLLVIGLFNNCLSILFIFHKEYSHLVLAIPLRSLYVSNLLATLGGFLSTFAFEAAPNQNHWLNVSFGLLGITVFLSDGLMALMATIRFAYSQMPSLVTTPSQLHKIIYVSVIIIAFYSVLVQISVVCFKFDEHGLIRSFHYTAFALITFCFNGASILMERKRSRHHDIQQYSLSLSKKLFQFIVLSTILFAFTTIPWAMLNFMLVFIRLNIIDCDTCYRIYVAHLWLDLCLISNCLLDNTIYALVSETYREELVSALKKLLYRACKIREEAEEGELDKAPSYYSRIRLSFLSMLMTSTNSRRSMARLSFWGPDTNRKSRFSFNR